MTGVNEPLAYALEQKKDWNSLFSLISSWPDCRQKAWYLGNYYLLGKCDYRSASESFGILSLFPDCPVEIYLRYGKSLHGCDRVVEALGCYLKVLVLKKELDGSWFDDALIAYGLACLELGLYRHWLQVMAKFAPRSQKVSKCLYLVAQAYFCLDQWGTGWSLYELRREWFSPSSLVKNLTSWHEDMLLSGSRILVSSELGIGDFVFFLRFVPQLRETFVSVSIVVAENLKELAIASGFFDTVYSFVDDLSGQFAWHLPICSICHFLQLSDVMDKPNQYLFVDPLPLPPRMLDFLHNRIRPIVALNWAGNLTSESPSLTVRGRSVPLCKVEKIEGLQDVDLVLVQSGSEFDRNNSPLCRNLHFLQALFDADCQDICSTARLLVHCDLLITNDTSLAHIGGALGLETWVMLKQFPSWQWGVSGHSNWYPNVKCFRQAQGFDWSSVVQDVDNALSVFVDKWRQL